jgi:hypothetical protein
MAVTIKSTAFCVIMLCSSDSLTFRRNISPPSSRSNSNPSKKSAELDGNLSLACCCRFLA